MDEEKRLSYFFLGLGVGVAVGLLFAPKSGEETRGFLKSKSREGKDYLRRRGEDLREQAVDYAERGKAAIRKQRETIVTAVEAGKSAYREAASENTAASAADLANEGV